MTATPENANLTDEQRATNRLRWLLVEAAAGADIPVTVGGVNAMAAQMATIMRDNGLVLTWLSSFEADVAASDARG
jgi:hypothetical protein